jgi:hypothetical protein
MAFLSELPPEMLLIIFSFLKTAPDARNSSWKIATRQSLLPLSQTNRSLWKFARPFLYEDIEILLVRNPSNKPKTCHLNLEAYLLCRSLQEDPLLASHVRTIEVRGLNCDYFRQWGKYLRKKKLHQPSLNPYTASQLATILASCIRTTRLHVHGGLMGSIDAEPNQVILSCIKSMNRLENLELSMSVNSRVNVIIHFLNAASTRLKSLVLNPCDRWASRCEEWSIDNGPPPDPKSVLQSLAIPAGTIPLVAFSHWMGNIQSLTITSLKLSEGYTSQGPSIENILTPCASTLRYISLQVNSHFDAPSLSDFDMSQCTVLETFSYEGPWWINPDDDPMDVLHTLFSRSYSRLNLEVTSFENPRSNIKTRSLQVLREAFTLADQQARTPAAFRFIMDVSDDTYHTSSDIDEIMPEFEDWMQDLRDRKVKVYWMIHLPEDEGEIEGSF